MKKREVQVDAALLAKAQMECGAATEAETVRMALEALVRRAAAKRILLLEGSEPGAIGTPRRREH